MILVRGRMASVVSTVSSQQGGALFNSLSRAGTSLCGVVMLSLFLHRLNLNYVKLTWLLLPVGVTVSGCLATCVALQ